MKKAIASLLTLILALSLAGCGVNIDSPSGAARSSENPGKTPSGEITLEEGREFNAFYWVFHDAEWDFNNLIFSYGRSKFENINSSQKFTAEEEMEFHDFNQAESRCHKSGNILDSLGYHGFDAAPQDGMHLLDFFMFKIEGSKQTNGNIITILIDTALNEDGGWFGFGAEAGDHAYLEANLDTESLTLKCKSSLERDGEIVDRTVLEVVILPDGTILFQFFHMENLYNDDSFAEEYAVFKRISGDSYSCVVADIGFDFNFTYNSIIGKGDMTAEQMARNHTPLGIAHIFTVEDRHVQGDMVYGKVNYETYETPASLRVLTSSPKKSDEGTSHFADITFIPSREFNIFYFAIQDVEQPLHDLIFAYAEAIPDLHDSTNVMMAFRDILNTNFWLESFFDMDDGTSALDWPALEATRMTSDGIVTVFVDDTLKDQYANAERGDHMRLEATLDTKNLTLSCERILERDGQYIERAVTEAVMLPDGTILLQRFIVGVDEVYGEKIAIFKRISGDSYSAIIADIGTDYGYTYSSIIGRGDITTEDMAQGYTVTHVFSVENGEVSYEKS